MATAFRSGHHSGFAEPLHCFYIKP
jgi:hypothetical protein